MDPYSFFVDPDPAVFLNADMYSDPALKNCGVTSILIKIPSKSLL